MSYQAQTWAVAQRTGNPGRKAVLMTLANMADQEHSCWPSQAYLAEVTELSERSVRGYLADLSQLGLVERSRRSGPDGRKSDRYVLAVRVLADVSTPNRQELPVAPTANRQELPVAQPAGAAGGTTCRLPENAGLQTQPAAPATGSSCQGNHQLVSSKNTDAPTTPRTKVRSVGSKDPDWVAWYAAYPKHKEPTKALAAYAKAIRAGVEPSVLLAGAQRYAEDCRRQGVDVRFVKYPATWLNAGCWADEYDTPTTLEDPMARREGESLDDFKARRAAMRQASGQ